jgi:hypothetical protein
MFSGNQSRNIMLPSEDSRNGAFDLKSSQIANIEPINIALTADNKPDNTSVGRRITTFGPEPSAVAEVFISRFLNR